MRILSRGFYERDPSTVAKELLGKILVRKMKRKILMGKIVETEAYYGSEDPASRAYKGRKNFNRIMWEKAGKAFIYMVHGNWLFNVVAHPNGEVGAVLIRAIEPLKGIEVMKRKRKVRNLFDLTNGPGKLTKAFGINGKLNGMDLTNRESKIFISYQRKEKFEIERSYRIGVTKDLPQKLRFFVKGNNFVSR